jgi:hypothetical protein
MKFHDLKVGDKFRFNFDTFSSRFVYKRVKIVDFEGVENTNACIDLNTGIVYTLKNLVIYPFSSCVNEGVEKRETAKHIVGRKIVDKQR